MPEEQEGRKDRKCRRLGGRKEEEGRMFRVSVAGAIIWADNVAPESIWSGTQPWHTLQSVLGTLHTHTHQY
jgi:hypothetical protein